LFCFVIYYLGHYPEVVQRFRQELDEVFGNDLTKPITYKDLDGLNYCEAIIKEVTRHTPVVFVNSRMNIETDNIGGYNWSKGTSFYMLYSAIMKREDYWTDPEKFDPNRFYKVEESDKYLFEKQNIKNSFNMFGEGIRICPGRKLAMIELKCLLASIYRKYDIELVDMNAPLKYRSEFINSSEELIVKVKPRKF
jgi:cytochrome P450